MKRMLDMKKKRALNIHLISHIIASSISYKADSIKGYYCYRYCFCLCTVIFFHLSNAASMGIKKGKGMKKEKRVARGKLLDTTPTSKKLTTYHLHQLTYCSMVIATNKLSRSAFDALSIGSGLVVAVFLCIKREVIFIRGGVDSG